MQGGRWMFQKSAIYLKGDNGQYNMAQKHFYIVLR